MSAEDLIAVSRDLLECVLRKMIADTLQIDSEWGTDSGVTWDKEGEICDVSALLGLRPGQWPEQTPA